MDPLIIAEIGINHNGEMAKAVQMITDAAKVGCKCVKFQSHCVEDEYLESEARKRIPPNASENIYDMMKRCSFSEEQERELKAYTEDMGMQYLCTPFSRAAVDRLERLNVSMYKIGSGECNNYPLIKHIVSKGKPVILSTGMNSIGQIDRAVDIIGDQLYAILHCVSEYPTPYEHVHLGAIAELRKRYGKPAGLSDHSIGIYTALAAIALGAEVVEKHFTSSYDWPGPDIPISISPEECRRLLVGVDAIRLAMGGNHHITEGEVRTADFAHAAIVTLQPIRAGMKFTADNLWVKRPAGEIAPCFYEAILGRVAACDIPADVQLKWSEIV